MRSCFSRLLLVLALLVAPTTMVGHAAARAAPDASAAMAGHHEADPSDDDEMTRDHCVGNPGSQDRSVPSPDCVIACAALPAVPTRVFEPARARALLDPPKPQAAPVGLHPEAATPPPRFS